MRGEDTTYSLDATQYKEMYRESIEHPDTFWADMAAQRLSWRERWDTVISGDPRRGETRWFSGGKLNASYNCIDRHVENGHGDQVAFYFEANDSGSQEISYNRLLQEVSRLANVLISRGVKKGDRVCIYMPMVPEAVYAMLACARIGAVHSVVFGGFSADALRSRIHDAECVAVITADISKRGDKETALWENVAEILPQCPSVTTSIVVRRTSQPLDLGSTGIDYHKATSAASDFCEPEWMDAGDPLFILYTSGSTGKPKGIVHTTGGYLLYAATTHAYTFDYREGDVYWCAADVGWITGHTYIVYGPLANRATSVLFEGIPTYPDASRYWHIIDRYSVNSFYSTPTAIRTLMRLGDAHVRKTSRTSLRILGTVGEPINPEAWKWYHEVVGRSACYIVDTWWQTETGGHALTPLPGTVVPKPGAAMQPFFGITPLIVDEDGNELTGECEGILLLKGSWPGQMCGLFNEPKRYIDTYFAPYPGYYYPGDGARRDRDGHIWITGRVDDTMNVSGRLIGTAEVESALVLHPAIAEAAVVAVPHEVKGSAVYAFVCPLLDATLGPALHEELRDLVKTQVGSFAKPEYITVVDALPKTRSGKIMRRILRKIASGAPDEIGDTSTLAEPEVVAKLVQTTKVGSS